MDTPYQPPAQLAVPDRATDETERKRSFWGKMIWVSGIVILLAPLSGLLAIGTHMARAFGTLAKSGAADPSELAHHISMVLLTTFYSFIFVLPALIFLIVSIIRFRRLPKPA